LKEYLQLNNIKSELLLGYVNQDERELTVKNFNNPEDLDFQVVIANPFTVAESISLHKGCHNAIYMERDYNCGNFLQSKDRIHRVGLEPDQITRYYYFLSENSIDEVINQKLDEKAQRMSKVIDGEIPLLSILDDDNETDLIQALIESYDKRNH
jgi:SNF2 family DNA or RNA helicase